MPTGAISLVLGTEKRGIDIPTLSPNFETNVPGLYVAGELGGMGLIRNAIEQGRQALESIHKSVTESSSKAPYDVVVIGAGPAGFSASLAAHARNLRYVTVEQETLGGTVAHFPRGKIVMTAPVQLPIIGQVSFSETTKEKLIRFWEDVEQRTGVKIHYLERMENIEKADDGFIVKTSKNTYHTKTLLLSIGRRGTPRKLGVPGEEQEKVVYRLDDPAQYRGKHVLVVGGGNSALEAAMSIAAEPDTTVVLSYRGNAFNNANPKNLTKLNDLAQENRLTVWMNSNVKQIGEESVVLSTPNGVLQLDNDAVIVCAGGVLPTPMLKALGVEIETKHGTL